MQQALACSIGQLAQVLLDQANWESCSCAVPGQESVGIVVASVIWTVMPLGFGLACSSGFIALVPPTELVNMTQDDLLGRFCVHSNYSLSAPTRGSGKSHLWTKWPSTALRNECIYHGEHWSVPDILN